MAICFLPRLVSSNKKKPQKKGEAMGASPSEEKLLT
jgi:hypothetical protein